MGTSRSANHGNRHGNYKRIGFAEPSSACYIYGIVDIGSRRVLRAKPIGRRASGVYTIPYQDIAAVVSKTDFEEYDPTEENLLAHNRVVQDAMDELGRTVMPLRFSTIARSEDDVIRILSSGYLEFKKKISSLKGKVEIVVTVFCDLQGLRQEASDGDDLRNPAGIEEAMLQRSYWLASQLFERLNSVSERSQLSDIIFEDMIMNGTFLLDKKSVQRFFEEITSFDGQFGRHLRIRCSGPYAPYSFIDESQGQG